MVSEKGGFFAPGYLKEYADLIPPERTKAEGNFLEKLMDASGGYTEYPFVAEFYDSVVSYRNRQDVAFFVEMAQRAEGQVLEIGCGTGRILIPTAKAGVDIVGFDASPFMLAVCRQKLSLEPAKVRLRVDLVQGDMRQYEAVALPGKPECVRLPYGRNAAALDLEHRYHWSRRC
jgi:SAM-dependent methyltransferase